MTTSALLLVAALLGGQDFFASRPRSAGGCSSLEQHIDFESRITDQTANGNDLTDEGTLTYGSTSPPFGSNFGEFDGSSDWLSIDEADLSASHPLANSASDTGAFTMCAAFLYDSAGAGNFRVIQEWSSGGSEPTGMYLENTSDQLQCSAWDVSNSTWDTVTSTGLLDGTWYTACCEYDGTNWSAYLDGVEVGTATTIGASGIDRAPASATPVLGVGRSFGGAFSWHTGDIDEIAIYSDSGGATFASAFDTNGAAACP